MHTRPSHRWTGLVSASLFLLSAVAFLPEQTEAQAGPAANSPPPPQRDEPQPGNPQEAPDNLGQPLPNLTPDQLQAFTAGQAEFERRWRIEEGLGPLFNGTSCAFCHSQPATGGAGPRYRSNFNFGFQDGKGFNPLTDAGGPLLQELALAGVMREQIPDQANVFSLRRVAPLFGLGLVEAIPDAQITALVDEGEANKDGISGRAALNSAGRVQRFGSQNQGASLRGFVEKALAKEIGITNSEAPPQTVTLMRAFIAFSAPLPPGNRENAVIEGERVFASLGCAGCHVPAFTTAPGAFTTADGERIDVAALQNQTLSPYSDFLLHDMGAELNDGVALGSGSSAEYRTTPLWGLRFRGNFLHDVRAGNIRQALLFHGGEAAASRRAYLALPAREQGALEAFLRSR